MLTFTESQRRLYEKLYADLGQDILALLADDDVNEIMLNPDGQLWADKASQGQCCICEIPTSKSFSIIRSVAGIHGFVVSPHNPRLEAEFPFYELMQGQRFTAQVPPIVSAPCFSIRKKSKVIFSLDDYVSTGRLAAEQAHTLRELVKCRQNILVCGGPGSGKTTLTNALIQEAVKTDPNQRFLILEDLPELHCSGANQVAMLTTPEVDMTGLLRASMRMRPDRILIGEVRGKEALDMLKAWNTGCPGGICTVHANGVEEAVQRILDLAMEAGLTIPPVGLVLHTIDAIVSVIRRVHQKGFIENIVTLGGYENGKFIFSKAA